MKYIVYILLLAIVIVIPGIGLSEDTDTVLLARTLYTLARNDDFESAMAIGTVVMNRVESPWYPNSVQDVLNSPHQFPFGKNYDARALTAARAIISGDRTLPKRVTEYQQIGSDDSFRPVEPAFTMGEFNFYYGR